MLHVQHSEQILATCMHIRSMHIRSMHIRSMHIRSMHIRSMHIKSMHIWSMHIRPMHIRSMHIADFDSNHRHQQCHQHHHQQRVSVTPQCISLQHLSCRQDFEWLLVFCHRGRKQANTFCISRGSKAQLALGGVDQGVTHPAVQIWGPCFGPLKRPKKTVPAILRL